MMYGQIMSMWLIKDVDQLREKPKEFLIPYNKSISLFNKLNIKQMPVEQVSKFNLTLGMNVCYRDVHILLYNMLLWSSIKG